MFKYFDSSTFVENFVQIDHRLTEI